MIKRAEVMGEPCTLKAEAHFRLSGDQKVDVPLEIGVDSKGRLVLIADVEPVREVIQQRQARLF